MGGNLEPKIDVLPANTAIPVKVLRDNNVPVKEKIYGA
jgi:hypothetical protein